MEVEVEEREVEVEIPEGYKAPVAEPDPAPVQEEVGDPEPQEEVAQEPVGETQEQAILRLLQPLSYNVPDELDEDDRFDAAKAAAHAIKVERVRSRMLEDMRRQTLRFGIPEEVVDGYISQIENYEVKDIQAIAQSQGHLNAAKAWAFDNHKALTNRKASTPEPRPQPRVTPTTVAPKQQAPKYTKDEIDAAKTFARVLGGSEEQYLPKRSK